MSKLSFTFARSSSLISQSPPSKAHDAPFPSFFQDLPPANSQ